MNKIAVGTVAGALLFAGCGSSAPTSTGHVNKDKGTAFDQGLMTRTEHEIKSGMRNLTTDSGDAHATSVTSDCTPDDARLFTCRTHVTVRSGTYCADIDSEQRGVVTDGTTTWKSTVTNGDKPSLYSC